MAVKRWRRSEDGNDGIWTNPANWDPVGVPADIDYAIIDGDVGIDGADQQTITLSGLVFAEDYVGPAVGADGDPLMISSQFLIMAGSRSEIWMDGEFDSVLVAGRSTLNLDGDLDELLCLGSMGRVTLADGMDAGPIRVLGVDEASRLEIGEGVGGITSITADSGRIDLLSDATNVLGVGAFVYVSGDVDITRLRVLRGTCRYDAAGQINVAAIFGTLDLSRNNKTHAIATTINAGEILVGSQTSFTNPIENLGGSITPFPGTASPP